MEAHLQRLLVRLEFLYHETYVIPNDELLAKRAIPGWREEQLVDIRYTAKQIVDLIDKIILSEQG